MTKAFDDLADAMQCSPILFTHAFDKDAIDTLKSKKNMTIVGYPSYIFARGPNNIEHLGAVDSVDTFYSWLATKIDSISSDDLIRKPQARSNRAPLYWTKPDTCVA